MLSLNGGFTHCAVGNSCRSGTFHSFGRGRRRRDSMHKIIHGGSRILGCCLLAAASTLALAQAAAPAKPAVGTPIPPAQVYGKLLTNVEKEFVDAAEAMPEDKY